MPGNDGRLAPHPGGEVVAGVAHLALMPEHQPGAAEDALELQLEDRRIRIYGAVHAVGLHQHCELFVGGHASSMVNRVMLIKSARLAAALLTSLLVACATGPAPQAPDAVLYNGKIVTVDSKFSVAQAVAIRGDRFVAVGDSETLRRTAGAATRPIDLGRRTVIPGLMDGHLHNAGGGPGVDLSKVRSMAELLAAIEARAKGAPPGELIISNSDWHEAQLRPKRLPHRSDLDRVAPRNPMG